MSGTSRRPDCSLLVFETTAPFRGLRVESSPGLVREGVDEPGVVLSWPLTDAKARDLSAILH